jgi:5-keto-L-gluconate epimerase
MKLSLAIQTPEVPLTIPVSLLEGSFEEKLSKAGSLGLDGVELMCIDPPRLDLPAILGVLQANRLAVSAIASGGVYFSTGLSLLNEDREKALQAQILLDNLITTAAYFQASVVTIGSFRGRLNQMGLQGLQRLQEILLAAAERAWSLGVRLAIEPLNRYETDLIRNTDEGLTFLSQADHPGLGLLLDTFHVNIEETSWTTPFSRVIQAGKLFHVHLGDNNRLFPGQGIIDFPAIFRVLRESDYRGYLSAELLAKPTADEAARQVVAYMRQAGWAGAKKEPVL